METSMLAADAVMLLLPLAYFGGILAERRWPAEVRPFDPRWHTHNLLRFVLIGLVNVHVANVTRLLIDRYGTGTGSGVIADVLIAWLLVSLGNAMLHRGYHRFDWLWRHVHRFHHEPERFDIAGVMHQTVFEMLFNAVLFSVVTIVILDLEALASACTAVIAGTYGMFQHLNLRTPAWLGPFIQRPESHRIHHQTGVHHFNYSDFPIWDMMFGTYRNGRSLITTLGLGCSAERVNRD